MSNNVKSTGKTQTTWIKMRSYRRDDYVPSKETVCQIPTNIVQQYLQHNDDPRNIRRFMSTYDNEEAMELCGYAKKQKALIRVGVKYSDEFENTYNKYVKRNAETAVLPKEEFYKLVYCA